MIDGNNLRADFAQYLTTHTHTRWGLDAALMHVCKTAYDQGLKDGASAPTTTLQHQQGETEVNHQNSNQARDNMPEELKMMLQSLETAGFKVKVHEIKINGDDEIAERIEQMFNSDRFIEKPAAEEATPAASDSNSAFPDLLELQAKIEKLEAQNKKMTSAITKARDLFSHYALQHMAKPSVEHLAKAIQNIEAAFLMNDALKN